MNRIKYTLSIKGKANHTSIGRVSGPSFASLAPNKKSSSEGKGLTPKLQVSI